MAFKSFVVICAQAVFIQMTLAQAIFPGSTVIGNSNVDNNIVIGGGFGGFGSGLLGSGSAFGSGSSLLGSGSLLGGVVGSSANGAISNAVLAGLGGYNVISSGPLAVTTISPIGPSGLAVASENAIEGILSVSGQLPYLSAVAFEGAVPSSGSGVATCGCGSGNVGIVSEGFPAGVGNAGLGLSNVGRGLGNVGVGLGNVGVGLGNAGLGLGGRGILY